MRSEEFVLIIGLALIMGGVVVIWMAMQSRRQFREMEHRERLALIERGLMPAPERDPAAFEQALGHRTGVLSDPPARARSAGIMMVAMGIGFAFLVGFAAGEPEVGIGVGGAFAILGVGFFVNAVMSNRRGYVPPTYTPTPYTPPRGPIRSDQPPQ